MSLAICDPPIILLRNLEGERPFFINCEESIVRSIHMHNSDTFAALWAGLVVVRACDAYRLAQLDSNLIGFVHEDKPGMI